MPSSIQVLLVDDDSDFLSVATTRLENANSRLEVYAETNASDAREQLATRRIDCIVSDFYMPRQDGIALLESVRETDPNLPFILFTGRGSETVASDAIAAGVTHYLQKDNDAEQYTILANRIVNSVEKYRAEQELTEQTQILETIVENMPIGLYTLDDEGVVTRAEGNGLDRIGVDPDATLGRSISELSEGNAPVSEYFQRALEGEHVEEVVELDEAVFQAWFRPLRTDAGSDGVVGLAADITQRREQEAELERQNDLFEKAQSIADVGAWEHDVEHGTGIWTDQLYRIHDLPVGTQLDLEEAIEFYHPEDRETVRTAVDRAIEECEPYSIEVRLITDDGEQRWVRARGEPQTEDGEVVRIRGTVQDITDRKHRERELERQNDLFAKAQDIADVGAWEYDAETDTSIWTEQLYRIYGLSPESEPLPDSAAELYHPDDRERVREAFQRALRECVPYDIEARLVTDDGEQRWVRTRGDPQTEDGEVVRIRGTVQDVTDRKAQEKRLKEKNERLEEFASIVSHDLRNPLNAAVAGLDMVAQDCDSEHVEMVARAHDRMDALIGDLLTLARQGDTVSAPEPVQLAAELRTCWGAIDTEDARLTVETDRIVEADPTLLRQLLENLVRNAVEHSAPGVTVRLGDLEGGFYVADDGPGIPEEERDAVFGRGYSTANDGTGFGLTIVEQTAAAHGWDVEITESADGGTRFEITGVSVVE